MIKHLKSVHFQKKFYFSKQVLKVLRNEVKLDSKLREYSILKLSYLPSKSSKVYNFRYCHLTKGNKSVKRFIYLSRSTIRDVFYKNKSFHFGLPGFYK